MYFTATARAAERRLMERRRDRDIDPRGIVAAARAARTEHVVSSCQAILDSLRRAWGRRTGLRPNRPAHGGGQS